MEIANLVGGMGFFSQLAVLAVFAGFAGKLTDDLLALRRQGYLKTGAALSLVGGSGFAGYMLAVATAVPGAGLPLALLSALFSAACMNTALRIKRHIVNTRIGRANWEAELKRRFAAQNVAEADKQKQD